MWTKNFQMFKLVLEKAEGSETKLPTCVGSQKKQQHSRKTPTSASLTTLTKAFDCVDYNKLWKIHKEVRIPDHITNLLRNVYAGQEATVRTRHGTMNWLKPGKKYVKVIYCHPAYLTYMQSTSCEMPSWMKSKLESRLPGEISIIPDMQITPPLW